MTSGTAVPPALLRYRPVVEDALRAVVGDGDDPLIRTARYVLGWEDEAGRPSNAGGKRVRPSLCLLAAEAVGGMPQDALAGAAAVELVHNFSLVHDDVQDRDAERHHRPTVWALFGEAQAINAGDYLFALAMRTLARADVPSDRRTAALDALDRAVMEMIRGQWLDISFESRASITEEEYLEMVRGKTGALLGASLEVGALLAGATPELAAGLRRWGEEIGLAFQAHDDYLGVWGDPDQTGKSNTSDIARRKKTLPVVIGLAHAVAGPAVRAAYAKPQLTPDDIAGVVRALEEAGAGQRCREIARRHEARARELLGGLDLAPRWRDELTAIGEFLVERAS
jgi:geranylgeranyl diphosphate synthase type I